MRGLFITFEGVEGSGKSTQIALLRDWLCTNGNPVFVTREPGGHPVAESIRAVLLDKHDDITARAEILLVLAARAQVTEQVIRPRLGAGDVVICDRYADSTVAYQGYGRGLDLATVRRLNSFATRGLLPGATVLLDLDPAVGLHRQTERNRMEAEEIEFHRRVRAGYLREAAIDPERYHIIDASADVGAVHARVVVTVRQLLPQESTA